MFWLGFGWKVVFVGAVGEHGGEDCGNDRYRRSDVVESVWIVCGSGGVGSCTMRWISSGQAGVKTRTGMEAICGIEKVREGSVAGTSGDGRHLCM